MTTTRGAIADLCTELAWSLWGELGVRGVVHGSHEDWSIDPEPLMVFTARRAADDPRLRDEALDWCIRYEQYVSRTRLRGVLRRVDAPTREAFGPFAATLAEHTNGSWPEASEAYRAFQPSKKSDLAPMVSPAMVRLRLRALFGVGARAEIVHAFVAWPTSQFGTAALARRTGYTKRNVTSALDRLELAGLLQVSMRSNRFRYRLDDAGGLLDFVGERPRVFPDWEPIFRVLSTAEDALEGSAGEEATIRAIEFERALADMEYDLDLAGLAEPPSDRVRDDPESLEAWMLQLARSLAQGTMPDGAAEV